MRKVEIKTWDEMEKEFGLDIDGDIDCKPVFTKIIEQGIPKDRIIKLSKKNNWVIWDISEDIIKKEINTKKPKASKNKKINKLKTKLTESEQKLAIANKTVCEQMEVIKNQRESIIGYLEYIDILEAKSSVANKTIKEKEEHLRIAENAIERKDNRFKELRNAYLDEIINKG